MFIPEWFNYYKPFLLHVYKMLNICSEEYNVPWWDQHNLKLVNYSKIYLNEAIEFKGNETYVVFKYHSQKNKF